ncbi:MAG: type ISP restriction/modification enzyme [Halobacteriota archaeon]
MNKTEKDKLKKILTAYLKEIHGIYTEGHFREESFYPSLKKLFENCSGFLSLKGDVSVLVSPKKTEVGFPDVLIRRDGEIVGHVEAKLPGANLKDVENSEQLKRYLEAFPNFILTNFLQFRLYRDAKLITDVEVCNQEALQDLKPPVPENRDSFFKLSDDFYGFSIPEMKSASELAVVLAKKTRFSKYILEGAFEREEKGDDLPLITGFYNVFQETLIGSLTKERFVDLYAQTITYGLFAAKMMAKEQEISKDSAWRFIPGKVPLLKDVFYSFSGPNTPESLSGPVDDILRVLNKTDILAIYDESFRQKKDPVIHFYETFLNAYNPEERGKLGVYYTPVPVVSYIVRSIHVLLKRKFKKTKGLAEEDVTLLDPAAGTLTFIIRAIREALSELKESHSGLIPLQIENHILPNYFAFELLIVPYIIGHLRAAMVLEREFDYKLKENERFKFYLTNSLEMKEPKQALLLPELTEEGREAKRVKEEVSILVVLGNPPYSVSSENKSEFIENLMEDYKKDVRKEKNIQPLSDDYIKFIRFAHWKIDQTGKGVVGFISNNSYLSGIIHRGMRKELLETFDEIYILNLHGSSRIGEKTPEGGKDENVFDIQQGVAIAIYVKLEKPLKEKKVYYADVWGLRKEKYKYLRKNDVTSTDWQELEPQEPYYFFVPKDFALQAEYDKFWKVTDIFKVWSSGVKTRRDKFMVAFSKEELFQRLKVFAGNLSDEIVSGSLRIKDTKYWSIKKAREEVRKVDFGSKIVPYAYRPFGNQFVFYFPNIIERGDAREPLMKHFLKENVALVSTRILSQPPFKHAFVSNSISDMCLISIKTKEASYYFPLYLYPDKPKGETERTPNFTTEFLQAIKEALGTEPTPEEIFYYIYAILYSPTYRKRYEEFLKIDFPGIPLPSDYEKFKKLSELGKELVELHLLRHPALEEGENEIGFPKSGSNKVEKVKYDEKTERVYFNKEQYFEGISKEVWEYRIGAYQVAEKYLKDRKGRMLSLEEIEHYMRVAKVIERTIEVQEKVEEVMG